MRSGSGTAFTFCSTLDKLEYLLSMNAISAFGRFLVRLRWCMWSALLEI